MHVTVVAVTTIAIIIVIITIFIIIVIIVVIIIIFIINTVITFMIVVISPIKTYTLVIDVFAEKNKPSITKTCLSPNGKEQCFSDQDDRGYQAHVRPI